MQTQDFIAQILAPGLDLCSSHLGIPYSDSAARLLLAIALQETNLRHRYQISRGLWAGPARGWWQFERGGGVRGVMTHHRSSALAQQLCERCHVEFSSRPIWRALEGHDMLATGFARLLLFTDPHRLPITVDEGWVMYRDRLWRPGKPHPGTWPQHWADASAALRIDP